LLPPFCPQTINLARFNLFSAPGKSGNSLRVEAELLETAMEHKGVQFAVVQTTNPYCWKWTAFLDAISSLTGTALTRADAVLDAELAIEKALERQETFKESTCEPDLVPRRSAPA
jgi:hypothetical protein